MPEASSTVAEFNNDICRTLWSTLDILFDRNNNGNAGLRLSLQQSCRRLLQ